MARKFDGKRCRELMAKRNVTGKDLAESIGISKGYFCDILNGKKHPSDKIVDLLADYFQCDEEMLWEGYNSDPIKRRVIEILDQLPESLRAQALAMIAELLERRKAGQSASKPPSTRRR